jgi:hypothetical protein
MGFKRLNIILHGYKDRSLSLKKQQRFGVFQNRVSGGIFGPKMDEVTGGWRNLKMNFMIFTLQQMLWG